MFFVIAGILALVAVLALAARAFGGRDARPAGAIGAGALALLAVFTLLMSLTTIEPRSVGIQTSFGRYVDTLENGTQLVAPWSNVEEFSTQLNELKMDVPVSFEGGSSGTVTVTNLWAVDGPNTQALWEDFKTFDRVRDLLVEPNTRTEVAAAFSAYQPQDARDGRNRTVIQNAIVESLSGKDNDGGVLNGRGVNIDSIQITNVELHARAQESVDRIAEADANTERANSEQERAVIEAETARIRQESQTPEALERYCLEITNSWDVAKNGPLPATWNCNGSGSVQTVLPVG